MIRRIIKIDTEKCNGCGECVQACHENAIGIIDGKAVLLRDDYCDGLGNCLPVCPMDAISFEEREAAAFDEATVKRNQQQHGQIGSSCTGTQERTLFGSKKQTAVKDCVSELRKWPVQLKLVPVQAAYFQGADILVAADCSAFAYGNFHHDFIAEHVVLIGCPKLDDVNYADKLTEIIKQNDIKRLVITRMEVPCCGGLQKAVETARDHSGKQIPVRVVTISVEGQIIKEEIR